MVPFGSRPLLTGSRSRDCAPAAKSPKKTWGMLFCDTFANGFPRYPCWASTRASNARRVLLVQPSASKRPFLRCHVRSDGSQSAGNSHKDGSGSFLPKCADILRGKAERRQELFVFSQAEGEVFVGLE
eukprot:scaffold149_cov315-Pinguiococcus_pyrenoidosus.AAC.77